MKKAGTVDLMRMMIDRDITLTWKGFSSEVAEECQVQFIRSIGFFGESSAGM
jgi:hypothetical protein